MIDLCGPSIRSTARASARVVAVDADDTTSMLFRMKDGMSGYLGTMTATGRGFSFQVFGSKGYVRLEGMTHVAGASSEERRTRLFGKCIFKPIAGPAVVWDAERLDVTKVTLEAFARAARGKEKFLIPLDEMVHGAARDRGDHSFFRDASAREGRLIDRSFRYAAVRRHENRLHGAPARGADRVDHPGWLSRSGRSPCAA